MEILYTVLAIITVTAIFSFVSMKKKGSSWEGTVTKKRTNYDEERGTTTYTLIFKTSEGKKVKWQAHKNLYEEAEVGDTYQKAAGTYTIEKIEE